MHGAAARRAASAARATGPARVTATSAMAVARRFASTAGGDENGGAGIDVEAIGRPMGYGPFSATAKARLARERASAAAAAAAGFSSDGADAAGAAADGAATVMQNVGLDTNLFLRLSLAGLPHPSQLQDSAFMSPAWRLAFVRLYRTILRLHNKTVAVSLRTARGEGAEAAVSAVTGVQAAASTSEPGDTISRSSSSSNAADVDDVLLRYLLTPEQQAFGNSFVQGEFTRHMDADAVSAAIFYQSWYEYVLQLASGVTAREMTEQEKRLLSDEQKEKLNSLRGAFLDLRTAQQPTYMP